MRRCKVNKVIMSDKRETTVVIPHDPAAPTTQNKVG